MTREPSGDTDGLIDFRVSAADYEDRRGFDPAFLGNAEFVVPLPELGNHLEDAPTVVDHSTGLSTVELKYHRFSLAMSRERKFCRYSAVNIHGGEPFHRFPRKSWRRDARLDTGLQEGNEDLYGRDTFSRGHMVRRLDPLWGDREIAETANWDTFHLTNACPQVQTFNNGLWGQLEDLVLEQADSRDSRLSVFSGPILTGNDPEFRDTGIFVPTRFYKIIVTRDESEDGLLALAFIQNQKDALPEMDALAPFGGFDPGEVDLGQVTVTLVESETDLDFGPLREADVKRGESGDLVDFATAFRPIQRPADILFRRAEF